MSPSFNRERDGDFDVIDNDGSGVECIGSDDDSSGVVPRPALAISCASVLLKCSLMLKLLHDTLHGADDELRCQVEELTIAEKRAHEPVHPSTKSLQPEAVSLSQASACRTIGKNHC